jgi:hypothetical protein
MDPEGLHGLDPGHAFERPCLAPMCDAAPTGLQLKFTLGGSLRTLGGSHLRAREAVHKSRRCRSSDILV